MTLVPLVLLVAAFHVPPAPVDDGRRLRQATVSLDRSCAGVVVGPFELLTAAHCIRAAGQSFRVGYASGAEGRAEAVAVDRASDLAVLRLAVRAPVPPLAIRATEPKVGESVLFTGRNDFGHPFEHAVVRRFGRCPSLPQVPQALFTTIQARPGDSGAPIVDRDYRVVGLVHGGARCHIAAPTEGAARLLARARGAEVGGPPMEQRGRACACVCRPAPVVHGPRTRIPCRIDPRPRE